MTKQIDDSSRLIWVEAFWAAANACSYLEAGTAFGKSATTVQRAVIDLEKWLHLVLITTDVPYVLTDDGGQFASTAERIVELIDAGDLRGSLSKTRVHADGRLTVDGFAMRNDQAIEIGRLLVDSRADISVYRPAPVKNSSAKHIDMDAFFAERITNANPST